MLQNLAGMHHLQACRKMPAQGATLFEAAAVMRTSVCSLNPTARDLVVSCCTLQTSSRSMSSRFVRQALTADAHNCATWSSFTVKFGDLVVRVTCHLTSRQPAGLLTYVLASHMYSTFS